MAETTCGGCDVTFPDVATWQAHLPCPGKQGPNPPELEPRKKS